MWGRATGAAISLCAALVVCACGPAGSPSPSPSSPVAATQTALPSATPDPSRCGTIPANVSGDIVFASDFTERCPALGSGESETFSARHTANGLRLVLKGGPGAGGGGGPDRNMYPGGVAPSDVRVEVDVEAIGPAKVLFGIECRYSARGGAFTSYRLLAGTDGSSLIEAFPRHLSPPLVTGQPAPGAIRQGLNHVRADCVGGRLALSVNGQQVVTIEDTELTTGLVGVYGRSLESSGAELVFRNFVVLKP